jgi:hypothetical protein
VSIEERVVEEELVCVSKERRRIGALLGESPVSSNQRSNDPWRFGSGDRTLRDGFERCRDGLHELVSEPPKCSGIEGERSVAAGSVA